MTSRADMDQLTKAFAEVKVSNDRAREIQGKGNFMEKGKAPGQARALIESCPQDMGKQYNIPSDEVIYVIAAHGWWEKNRTAKGVPYPDGHDTTIRDERGKWENLRFGVLVGEGVNLAAKLYENKQQAVMRHIEEVFNGTIKVFQRFAWSEKPLDKIQDGDPAFFPNLVFSEGGEEKDPFIATIARYFDGNVYFFQLKRSVLGNSLIPFNGEGRYPVDMKESGSNLNRSNMVLLSELLPLIEQDVQIFNRVHPQQTVKKTNIIFATCLQNIPETLHKTWTGKDLKRTHIGGGRKRKYRKKKKRKTHRRRKKRGGSKKKTRIHRKRGKKET